MSQTKFKVLLIEDMDVLIAPKVQHKSHISVRVLSVIGVPQVVEYEGKVYNFDGKIGVFPCTEEYFTQRKSKKGPKGTRSVRSVNVDSEFYHNFSAIQVECMIPSKEFVRG